MADLKNKTNKSNTAISNKEIAFVVFLMFVIVVIPIALSVWHIGTPIPGYN